MTPRVSQRAAEAAEQHTPLCAPPLCDLPLRAAPRRAPPHPRRRRSLLQRPLGLLSLFCLQVQVEARISIEAPPPLPAECRQPGALATAYEALRAKYAATNQEIDSQSSLCYAVQEGSALGAQCVRDAHQVQDHVLQYRRDLAEFKPRQAGCLCPALGDHLQTLTAAARRAALADDVYALYERGQNGSPNRRWSAPRGYQLLSDDVTTLQAMLPGHTTNQIADLLAPPHSGYRAAIYQDQQTHALVLVFRGTIETDSRDWTANVTNEVLHHPSSNGYFVRANALGAALKSYAAQHHYPLEIVGHSLGGALATWAGVKNDVPVTTFNPEAIRDNQLLTDIGPDRLNQLVTNYVTSGEAVSTVVQGDDVHPPGREIEVPLAGQALGTDEAVFHPVTTGGRSIDWHRIGVMRGALQMQIHAIQQQREANHCSAGNGP